MRRWSNIAAAICAFVFILVLGVSAFFDPTIRLLHLAEALPYLAAAILTLRGKKLGMIIGFASGALWVTISATRTTFIGAGFQQLAILLHTGSLPRPDLFIAVPAALSTAGLALFSLISYSALRNRGWRDLAGYAGAVVGMLLFFAAIFAAFQPRYLPLLGIK